MNYIKCIRFMDTFYLSVSSGDQNVNIDKLNKMTLWP